MELEEVERAMPESTEATDEVLGTRHRKCLVCSMGLQSVDLLSGRPAATRKSGFEASLSVSGSRSCLVSPRLTLSETRRLDTWKPISVKSGSWDIAIDRPQALRDRTELMSAKCVYGGRRTAHRWTDLSTNGRLAGFLTNNRC